MKPLAIVLAVVGLVLLGAGLGVGFGPVSRDGVTCGSAFKPDTMPAGVADYTRSSGAFTTSDSCQSARSDRKTFAVALVVPGAVCAAGLLCTWAVWAARRIPA